MKTFMNSSAKGLAIVLSAAMVLGASVVPANAKAKKPKLSTTKVSLSVGAKKKVKVKNAKKVTCSINKNGKKVVSLSKKTKKGFTIKAKKAGTAKITVKMKYSKGTVKKKVNVTVTNGTGANKDQQNQQGGSTPNSANNSTPAPSPTPSAEPSAEPTATPTPLPAAYKVDFEKDAKFEDGNCGEQTVSATGATVTFGQFQGIFYTLPDTEEMRNSNYKYAYITYTSEGDELKVSFLNKDAGENGLADPLETYGRQVNDLRVEVGTITATEEEQTMTLTSDDGIATNGVQIFNWGASAELVIKNIVFSEQELTKEQLAAITQ